MNDVTQILGEIEGGNRSASAKLLPLVYDELRKLAAAKMTSERGEHTLQATALVHEAYLRLVEQDSQRHWDGRGHFFSAAAEAMRRILIERARQKKALKRGGELKRVEFQDAQLSLGTPAEDLLALDEALSKLETAAPEKAELVKLRYFAGMTVAQAAEAIGISTSTADNYWAYARAWLRLEISGDS